MLPEVSRAVECESQQHLCFLGVLLVFCNVTHRGTVRDITHGQPLALTLTLLMDWCQQKVIGIT